jgi:hypothetical protein
VNKVTRKVTFYGIVIHDKNSVELSAPSLLRIKFLTATTLWLTTLVAERDSLA